MANENLKAIIDWKGEDLFIGTTPSDHDIVIDTDHLRHSGPSPMELLLLALGSCSGVDVVSILRKKRQDVAKYHIEVRGERRTEHPRSYKRLQVHHILTGRNLSNKAVAQAIELSENKYCSVAATFRPAAEIVSSFEIIEVETL